jgi:hypothetical protein
MLMRISRGRADEGAVLQQEAPCIAAGGHRAVFQFQKQRRVPLTIGALDSNLPFAVRRRTTGAQIAAEIHQ